MNNCNNIQQAFNLMPVLICVRLFATVTSDDGIVQKIPDPFGEAQPAYLIGFVQNGQQAYRLEYPLGTPLPGSYSDWEQISQGECKMQMQNKIANTTTKQVEYGEVLNTSANLQAHVVVFATPFPSPPFITITSGIQYALSPAYSAINVTVNGFTLGFYAQGSSSDNAGPIYWKAEEK